MQTKEVLYRIYLWMRSKDSSRTSRRSGLPRGGGAPPSRRPGSPRRNLQAGCPPSIPPRCEREPLTDVQPAYCPLTAVCSDRSGGLDMDWLVRDSGGDPRPQKCSRRTYERFIGNLMWSPRHSHKVTRRIHSHTGYVPAAWESSRFGASNGTVRFFQLRGKKCNSRLQKN